MGEIAPEEQFLPVSTIFYYLMYYLMLDFYVKTGIRHSLRDKRLFEITEVEITRVDCTYITKYLADEVLIAVYDQLFLEVSTTTYLHQSRPSMLLSKYCNVFFANAVFVPSVWITWLRIQDGGKNVAPAQP